MKTIVVSAVNLRDGGPLSVLKDCLSCLELNFSKNYRIVALVHKKSLFNEFENIEFLEFERSAVSYFYRVYLEYFYFNRLSVELKPYLWFSLHDITPSVCAERRAVYCHNPSPFYKISLREAFLEPKFLFLNFFYSLFYSKNIKKNNFVVVQQDWLRKEFKLKFNINNVVVSYPSLDSVNDFSVVENNSTLLSSDKKVFLFPSFPRVFKNLETVCEAVRILSEKQVDTFEVWLTVDGSENKYSRLIFNKYSSVSAIKFLGLQPRKKIIEWYDRADALIFPSKLETWGLPITEFKPTGKPMLIADLPYAHETVGNYDQVDFFDVSSADMLAGQMLSIIEGRFKPSGNKQSSPVKPFVNGWRELFCFMLK